MSQWFRWHAGTVEDAKFRVTARNAGVTIRDVIALWAFLLEDAASDKHRGISTRGGDFVAAVLDMELEVVNIILEVMTKLEMISVSAEGITIKNWGKRQYETDTYDNTNAERQRRWRNNHKPELKRERNGNVTAPKPPETETETETETEKKEESIARKRARSKIPLPENWSPMEELSSEDLLELERFGDHARANDRRCADWFAAWRNWKRSPYRSKGGQNGHGRRHGSVLDAFDRLGEKLKAAGATDNYVPGSSGPRPLDLDPKVRPKGLKLIPSR